MYSYANIFSSYIKGILSAKKMWKRMRVWVKFWGRPQMHPQDWRSQSSALPTLIELSYI